MSVLVDVLAAIGAVSLGVVATAWLGSYWLMAHEEDASGAAINPRPVRANNVIDLDDWRALRAPHNMPPAA